MPHSGLSVVNKFTVKQKILKVNSQFKVNVAVPGPESHFFLISLLYNSNEIGIALCSHSASGIIFTISDKTYSKLM